MRQILIILLFVSVFSEANGQPRLKTENVILITLDGFRWQELFTGADSLLITNKTFVKDPLALKNVFWAETSQERRELLMPFFWKTVSKQGVIIGNRKYGNFVNCSNSMWFSYPGYNEILTGYSDDARIKSNNKIHNPNVTVLEFLNQQSQLKGKVAVFGSWDLFPFIINEERSGIPVNGGYENAVGSDINAQEKLLNKLQGEIPGEWSNVRFDAFTHNYALEYLKRKSPRVMFISYGETDDFAHDGKYDAYLKSANQTDKFIGELWNWVQSSPTYKDKTTFIITTDHGRGTVPIDAWKNHGEDIAGAGEIWFAIIGPDTASKGELKARSQYYQSQVAKTLAAFFNIKYQPTYQNPGEVIRESGAGNVKP
jgi:hypothetical protein